MLSYSVGDAWNAATALTWCTVTDNVDPSLTCDLDDNSVNTSIAGTYTITYTATDTAGNTGTLQVIITVTEEGGLVLTAYYQSADGLTGNALLLELRDIISVYTFVSYDDARYILDDSDASDIPGEVILVYNRASVSGVWDAGVTWNREHVWPQSLLGLASDADIHNLKPANPSINSTRGNKPFIDKPGGGIYGAYLDGWYPGDADKGDIARVIFYMITRWDLNVTLVGDMDTFKAWHESDPVDDFERDRNEVLYGVQDNRNPFIDYPEFVEMIWGPIELSTGDYVMLSTTQETSNLESTQTTHLYYVPKKQGWVA